MRNDEGKAEELLKKEAGQKHVQYSNMVTFFLDWGKHGHPAVDTFENEAALTDQLGATSDISSQGNLLNKPFVLKSCTALQALRGRPVACVGGWAVGDFGFRRSVSHHQIL